MNKLLPFRRKLISFQTDLSKFEQKVYVYPPASPECKNLYTYMINLSCRINLDESYYVIIFMMYANLYIGKFTHKKNTNFDDISNLDNLFWEIGTNIFPSMKTTMQIPIKIIAKKLCIYLSNNRSLDLSKAICRNKDNLFILYNKMIIFREINILFKSRNQSPDFFISLVFDYAENIESKKIEKDNMIIKEAWDLNNEEEVNNDLKKETTKLMYYFLMIDTPFSRMIEMFTDIYWKNEIERARIMSSRSRGRGRGRGRGR